MKLVSQLDQNGYFISATVADESPLEKGVFLIPAGAVGAAPPALELGFRQKWDGAAWIKEPIPAPVPDPVPTLEEFKALKNAEINVARLSANRATFAHATKVFACDELSRSDIDGANGMIANLGAMPPGWPGGWKAVDNTYLPITTVAEWKEFYGSMFAAGAANFAHAQALKDVLAAATTPEQVAAIAW